MACCAAAGLAIVSADGDDSALAARLNYMFLDNRDLAFGTKVVYRWVVLFPRFGRLSDARLPRNHRALEGWARLAPPRSRIATACYVMAAVAAVLRRRGHGSMG